MKASLVVCATAATAKDAPTRRAFAKYILTVLGLVDSTVDLGRLKSFRRDTRPINEWQSCEDKRMSIIDSGCEAKRREIEEEKRRKTSGEGGRFGATQICDGA